MNLSTTAAGPPGISTASNSDPEVPYRGHLAAACLSIVIGILISALPHLLWWPRLGVPVWLADYDNIIYAQLGAQAYDNHPTHLADPVVPFGSRSPYSDVALLPAVIAAKVLGLGPMDISLVWRVWSGFAIGLTTYLLVSQFVKRPLAALAATSILLVDAGNLSTQLLIKPAVVTLQILSGKTGDLFSTYPQIMTVWRIGNPALTLPFVLLQIWLLTRARESPTVTRIVLAGLGFGLCFFAGFYFWTTAGLGLVLGIALDPGRRKMYFHVGWIGVLAGLYAIITSYHFKKEFPDDWLLRADKFLSIPRFHELLFPKASIGLLALGLMWALWRRRDLIPVATVGLAGLLLLNHQVVSKLQIENFHWIFVFGPVISLLTVLVVADILSRRLTWSPTLRGLLVAGVVVHLALGLWLRGVEATRTLEPREILADYANYRAQRVVAKEGRLVPNAIIGGDQKFADLAAILENQRPLSGYTVMISPYINHEDWDDRIALNAFLLGRDTATFEREQRKLLATDKWGPWSRDTSLQAVRLARRLSTFAAISADPPAALDRFKVRYVALPRDTASPAYLQKDWRSLQAGATWNLWERPYSAR